MTNDEIKTALKKKQKIRHNGIVYERAQAWRVAIDIRGEWISSLELVDRENRLVIARADECEVVNS